MALELVGGALLSAFLQVAFQKLDSPQVKNFFRQSKLDEKLLSKLKIKLHSIQALADDAEQKQFRDPHIRNWLLNVKDALLDAEDLLDEIQCELSKREDEAEAESESQTFSGCTCKVPNFFKSSPVSSFHKGIKPRMEEVLGSLELLLGEQDPLGLRNARGVVASGLGCEVSQKSQSTSLPRESVIYGRDDDKQIIFNWLTSDTDNHSKISILSIVGMGGLGKTTLAQHVYNDSRIQGKFDIKAWVCVSDDFVAFNVARTILEAITGRTDDSRNLEMVHNRLEYFLEGKKFLLVLDDIWNERREEWEAVQTPLVFGAQGSRILVTTRSKEVASTMRSKEYHLELLQEDYCWQLFAQHAFENVDLQPNPHFEEIGTKIVEKCKRLPLALKTVGSLLNNKSVPEWTRVLQSEIWELGNNDIVPALALSYHHLPSHLKRCFAYCALFPKDYLFDKDFLIQFWMALKFLQCPQQSSMSPEKVGEHYFNDLLSRSFFQKSSGRDGRDGFVMHDLLNDLAKYVCGDISFRKDVDAKRLRAFLPLYLDDHFLDNYMPLDELLSKFKSIRILSLNLIYVVKCVPKSIGNLKHLCWLDLSDTDIEKLPESILSFYNLLILKLNKCQRLKELPPNLHKLTNLRILELSDTALGKVPAHLGKLKNLQVWMTSFYVSRSSEFNIQHLGELNLCGKQLSILNLQYIQNPFDASAVDLKNKTNLVELRFMWYIAQNLDDATKERDEIVIENLQPSKYSEQLTIFGYGGKKLPSWFGDNTLSNVVSLQLLKCKYCECLPPLGVFPFLKNLRVEGLDGIVSIEADFYGTSSCSFPSLETLKFSSMEEWEKWEGPAVTNAFPHLQYLSIEKCPKLKGNLPEQLHHLKQLEICYCEQLETSLPTAPEICELNETSLERLANKGHSMLEYVRIKSCRGMNISMSGHHNFLVELRINAGCDSLTSFSLDMFPTLGSLKLKDCRNLQMISQENAHNHLTKMRIIWCDSLTSLSLDMFPTLESLNLRDCRNLQVISQENAHNHLTEMRIIECRRLEFLPKLMHILLPSLGHLSIQDCPNVELLPDGSLPSNLKWLDLINCSKLLTSSLKGALRAILSIENLYMGVVEVESFPDEALLLPSLITLSICDAPNLTKLYSKSLCYLSSLQKLYLRRLPRLECLPELPNSISKLVIKECPFLKQRCEEGGKDWSKIAHITGLDIEE